MIERFREQHGDKRVALLRRDHFEKMLSEITSPTMRYHWLQTIRGLLKSGIPSMIKEDPTAGLVVKRPRTEGHWTWTDAEIAQYRAHHPLGTQARLVLEFALESTSRREEIVRLGPQHLYRGRDGEWRIRIARIKGSRDVDIPMTAGIAGRLSGYAKRAPDLHPRANRQGAKPEHAWLLVSHLGNRGWLAKTLPPARAQEERNVQHRPGRWHCT